MKRIVLLLIGVLLFAVGCQTKSSNPATSTKDAAGGDPVLGAVQNVRKAGQRVVTANELRSLHLFVNDASLVSDRMPSKEEILAAAKQAGDRKLAEFIQDGTIVLTGAKRREEIWAYEKDAPTNGGWVVTSSGPEQMSAAQLKQRLAGN